MWFDQEIKTAGTCCTGGFLYIYSILKWTFKSHETPPALLPSGLIHVLGRYLDQLDHAYFSTNYSSLITGAAHFSRIHD